MEISIVKFEGKPVEKLIGEVSKAIGLIYKPRAIRKEAEAEAFKIETIAKANAKKALIEYEAENELVKRTKERLFNQEINRQKNLEEITEKSINFLPETVSAEPLDSDWRTRFFNKAQDISESETQKIWAKILAEEVSIPGKISIRTLEVISNLTKKEAELFQIACGLATAKSYILKSNNDLKEFGLTFSDILTLRDAGLIHDSDNLVVNLVQTKILNNSTYFLVLGNDYYQLQPRNKTTTVKIALPQYSFTTAGKELCSILNIPLITNYFESIKMEIMDKGFERINYIPTKK